MFKRHILFLSMSILLLVLWALPALAEIFVDTAWVRRYDGPENRRDSATDMAIDDSGNVYVTGGSWFAGSSYDCTTIKYYSNGDTAWFRRYNGPSNTGDVAFAIAADDSGNVYVTGVSIGQWPQEDYVTVKYYSNGETAWGASYNGPGNEQDRAWDIAVDGSGHVYVTGESKGSGTHHDYATIKYGANGDTAWVRRYNGPTNGGDRAYALAVDGSGCVYVTGHSHSIETNYDYSTIKYDANGTELWVRRYNGEGNGSDVASAIAIDGSDNVYVAGTTFGHGTWGDFTIVKYYPNGDTAWARSYNGPANGYDRAYAIIVDDSGNICATGYIAYAVGEADFGTIKYDSSGYLLWMSRYNGPGNMNDIAFDITTDSSNNVYVTGVSGFHPSYDYATVKYDSHGGELWVRRYNGTGNGNDEPQAIVVDDRSNVYVTGWSEGSGSDNDYATLKYSHGLRGDTDSDGLIDLDDVIYLIDYLYLNGSPPVPVEAGNANCDQAVDAGDVVYLTNYVLKGGPPPDCP